MQYTTENLSFNHKPWLWSLKSLRIQFERSQRKHSMWCIFQHLLTCVLFKDLFYCFQTNLRYNVIVLSIPDFLFSFSTRRGWNISQNPSRSSLLSLKERSFCWCCITLMQLTWVSNCSKHSHGSKSRESVT